MIEKIMRIKDGVKNAWENIPWFRAAGILGFSIGGLVTLNHHLPPELSVDLLNSAIKQNALTVIVILYFFLVAIFSGDRLRFETKLRALEQNYKYDNRGTLYNGGQPNIAFRITTFKGVFEGMAGEFGADTLGKALIKTGRDASKNFASNLEEIYNKDVASRKAKSNWDDLSLADKLNQWADYDSATGWGILACSVENNNVRVVVNHLHGLFEGRGGEMFGKFLAGYVETIISVVVSNHKNGKFSELTGCRLEKTAQNDKYTLELEYILL